MSLDFCHSGLSGPQTQDILRGNRTSSQPWMFTGNLLLFSNQIKTLYRIFSVWICIMPSSQSPSLQGESDCCLIEQPVIRFLWPKINSNYSTRQRTSTRRHAETYRRVKSHTFFKDSRVEIKNLPVSRCSETQMSSALCCDYSFTTGRLRLSSTDCNHRVGVNETNVTSCCKLKNTKRWTAVFVFYIFISTKHSILM